jgi:uncharacterized membrane protein YdbT with pleckstrin-like domain
MSYVEENLIPGERVLYSTGLHWVVLVGSFASGIVLELAAAGLIWAAVTYKEKGWLLVPAVALLLLGGGLQAAAAVKKNSIEMAVTNKRVCIKTGMTTRRTFELLLSKIESIAVEEDLWGRMLGYGTVIVSGTGGSPEPFPRISHPLEFRKHVQEQIELYQENSVTK